MANYLLAKYEDVKDKNPQFKYRRRMNDGRVILSLRDGMLINGVSVEVVTESQLQSLLGGVEITSKNK